MITYSIESVTEDFKMNSSGALIINRTLNYALVPSYSFTVKAQDSGGKSDTTSIQINVKDPDNWNPYFLHNLYYAFIPEEQVGFSPTIQPEAIKALPGDPGIDTTLTYSISSVTPEKYRSNFEIDSIGGNLSVVTAIDREEMDSSIISVNIKVDQVTDGRTATAQVRVEVEDVNEAPQFPPEVYKASVFSTDPFKTPVIVVKASDPDVGDEGRLEYSLVSGSPYFDVDASSGLVFVVSVVDLSGQAATVEVKVTDPKGLNATAKVEVEVLGGTSSNDMVTISLNRPANVVERNIPEMEKSLGKALGWTVDIIQVYSSTRGSPKSRTLAVKSLVNFIAVDKAEVVSYEQVVRKLQSESAAVTTELTIVFGEGVQFAVEERPKDPDSDNLALTISLGVIVPCVIILVVIFVLKRSGSFRRLVHFSKKAEDQAMKMDNVNQDRQSNRGQRQ
ncbi:cadherin EGF LAG seven-pass G-type receptor 2-like [Scomber scombrus]|uniref:Cadherin EGF LAG seven-pass G-type receptor 2-like n=1 Tax=Scomber scombrus TaxID=13677 RepID=A0AAV1QMG8_SCOSC